MKKLVAVLAVLSFVPAAQAADFTWGGSHRVQYFDTNNATDFDDDAADATSSINQRTRISADVKAGEKMNAHVGLVHNAAWGSNADQTPDAAGADDSLTVNEAYVGWMMSDSLTFKAGRQSATVAGGEVISANEWENVQYAFDGALLSYDHEMAKISGFGVRAADTGNDNVARFWGLNLDFKNLPEWLKAANLHYIIVKVDGSSLFTNPAPGSDEEDSTRLGLSASGAAGAISYRAVYAMHTGEVNDNGSTTSTDIDGSMMEAEVGYTNADMRNLYVGLVYHTDSGDDGTGNDTNENYDAFYYNQHANAGRMDILGWGNLTYQQVALAADLTDDLRLSADYYMFTKTEKDGDSFGAAGWTAATQLGAITTVAGEDDLGTELDITLTKKYSNNFNIAARYSMFEAGDAFGADADGATQIYLEGNLTF